VPDYGQLLIGNGTGGYDLAATSSLGIAGGGGGGTPAGTDTEVQFNNDGSFDGATAFTFASSTDLLTITNASTTNLVLSGAPSGFLQTNAQGVVSATSTFSAGSLFGTLGIANGGTSATGYSAGELLAFSGTQFVSTSTIGNNQLQNSSITINGTNVALGGSATATAASSTLLANNNTFSGDNLFTASTTIGGGTQAGGLTIFGGATTTGSSLISGVLSVTGKTILTSASTTVLSVAGNSYLGTAQASTFNINSIISCTGSEALQTDGSGDISCGAIATGGASSGGGWTTNNAGRVSLSTTTDLVAIGATTTPYAKLTVISGATGTTTLALVPASAQTANIIDIYAPGGGLNSVFTASGSVGIGTTTPGSILSINGVGNFVANATSTLYNALTIDGNLSLTGVANSLLSTNANGQVVATTSIGTSLLTGVLPVANGGTGSSTLTGILKGNGTGQVQTAVGGTDYEFPLTFSTGLNRTGNTITNTGVLLLGSGYATTTASAISFSTSTASFNGLTLGETIGASSNALNFIPTISGTLGNAGLAHSTIQVNGTTLTLGDSADTLSAASSTLLANNNTFSATNSFTGNTTFANATSTNFFSTTASSTNLFAQAASFGALNLTNALTPANGGTGITTTPSYGQLLLGNGTNYTLTATSSLGLQSQLVGSTGQVAYFSGANTAVGTSSLAISSAGFVGIGTTTPIDELAIPGLANPLEASSTTSGLSTPNSVYVQGRYAYVASQSNSSLVIFDISNPASPTEISSITSGLTGARSVYVSGRYAYVASAGNSSLVVFDISNPASPVEVGSTSSGLTVPESVYVSGRYAYVANGGGSSSLVVFDISNPASPTEIGTISTGLSQPQSVYVQGRYAYVANLSNSSLVVFDISNPASPVEVGSTTSGLNGAYSVYVSGRYAYVASAGNSSLVVFDISNPASPTRIGTTSTGLNSPESVYVSGRYAYVASFSNSSLVTFDISNPASPVEVGSTYSGLSLPRSVYVQGRYAYVASGSGINSSLVTFQIGGEYTQSLEAGTLQAGSLQLDNNLQALDGAFQGGLTVGNNLNVGGSFSLTASTFNAGTTATQNYSIFSINTASSTSPLFTTLYNGNVGLGTTTPGSALSINGVGNFVANATSTLYNGLNVTGGCVAVNGTCLGSSSASSTLLTDNNAFSGGNLFLASTTIGNGNQNGGLTINGGATTTGNAYFAGNVGIFTSPVSNDGISLTQTYSGTTNSNGGLAGSWTYSGSSAASKTFDANYTARYSGTTNSTVTSAGGGLIGGFFEPINASVGYNVAQQTGLFGFIVLSGTDASTTDSSVFQAGAANVGSGDILTNSRGLWVRAGTVSGTETNWAGIDIENNTSASNNTEALLGTATIPTGNYGLYQADTNPNYFGGNVGIGTTNPGTVNLLVSGTSGDSLAGFTYGSSGSPLPVNPAFGYSGIYSTVYGTPGTGTADPFTAAVVGTTHLSAGTRGIAVGVLAESYNDGTWAPGASTNSGNVAVSANAFSTNAGSVFGAGIAANVSSTTGANLRGAEIDTVASVNTASKYGLIIVSPNGDTGTVTGTDTVNGSGATVTTGAALQLVAVGSGTGYPNGILSYESSGGTQPIATTGTLWRSGGYAVTNGLDWSDMTFSGSAIKLPNAAEISALNAAGNATENLLSLDSSNRLSLYGGEVVVNSSGEVGIGTTGPGAKLSIAQALSGSATTPIIAMQNTAGVDAAGLQIAGLNYVGSPQTAIDFIQNSNTNFQSQMTFSTDNGGGLNEAMRITNVGNVGIGTTTPGSLLSLNNIANFTAATSTFYSSGGINLTNGCFSIAGTCVGGGASLSGTQGQVAYFSGTNTAVGTSSLYLASSGNVGIGTTSPASILDVVNNANSETALTISNSTSGTAGQAAFQAIADSGNYGGFFKYSSGHSSYKFLQGGDLAIYNSAGGNIDVLNDNASGTIQFAAGAASTAQMVLNTSGNVGIGTTTPVSKLTVSGAGCFTVGSGATVACGTTAGDLYYTAANTGNYDVAEDYVTSDPSATPGTVVGLDEVNPEEVATATSSSNVLGVVSSNPGLILGGADASTTGKDVIPIALSGRVPVKMSLANGPIDIGDRLALSTTSPGVAVKALATGETIGIALETATSSSSMIDMFVQPQFIVGPDSLAGMLANVPLADLASSTIGQVSATPASSIVNEFLGAIFAQITQWLANASNGIGDLYATVIHASTGDFSNELCVGSTCVTPAQFQAMVAAAGASQGDTENDASASSTSAASDTEATDTPPVIQINGDNPAIVQVGATYNDLGATITGPTADLNLGITTYVNGIETGPVQIDTSTVATDTIDYVVTDQTGLTSTSTRTVVIEASPSIVPTDDASSTANDAGAGNAPDTDDLTSSTAATTTAQ
jgi:hypothetical protein